MTIKLYMKNPYMKEFEGVVTRIDGNKVILDKTAFFAESGGQVGDIGYLNKTKVVDTIYDKNKENVLHVIEGEPEFREGDKIKGIIDWDRRYKIMKNHAASHIMEYFLFKIFGKLRLIGTSVSERHDSSTYEYSEVFSRDKLEQVENLSNELISKGYKIERWEDPDKHGWWYWKSGEITMSCGGTHPDSVKELGKIMIKRKSGGKGKEKVLTLAI